MSSAVFRLELMLERMVEKTTESALYPEKLPGWLCLFFFYSKEHHRVDKC